MNNRLCQQQLADSKPASSDAYREFEVGFNDGFSGKDCLRVTSNYVTGYLKGIETAKKTGRQIYQRRVNSEER